MTSRELAEVALVTVVATLAAAAPAPLELAGFDAKVLAAGAVATVVTAVVVGVSAEAVAVVV